MHFLITYGIVPSLKPVPTGIEKTFQGIIKTKPSFQALGNTFIVRLDSQVEYQDLLTKLTNLSGNNGGSIHFLMTPLMHGGRYNGFVPQSSWQSINKLTDS